MHVLDSFDGDCGSLACRKFSLEKKKVTACFPDPRIEEVSAHACNLSDSYSSPFDAARTLMEQSHFDTKHLIEGKISASRKYFPKSFWQDNDMVAI